MHFTFTNPTSETPQLWYFLEFWTKIFFFTKKRLWFFWFTLFFLFCFRTIYTSTLQLCNSKFIFNDLNLYSSNYIPLYQQSINQTCIVYPNVSFLNFMFSFNSRIQSFYSRTRPCATVDHKVDLTSPSCNVVFTQPYFCFSQVEQLTRIRLWSVSESNKRLNVKSTQ